MVNTSLTRRKLGLSAAALAVTGALTACAKTGTQAEAIEVAMNEKTNIDWANLSEQDWNCLLYTSPSPRDRG